MNFKKILKRIFMFEKSSENKIFELKGDEDEEYDNNETVSKNEKTDISKKLDENLQTVNEGFTIPLSGDVIVREFNITVMERVIPAFIVFIDGMVDRNVMNNNILQPLMILSNIEIKSNLFDIAEFVRSRLIPHNQLKEVRNHKAVFDEVNFGGCGIYIDGINSVFVADVKGWEHRGVEKPITEQILRGPQEAFNELLRSNTAAVRRRLKDQNLIVESIAIGERSKTPCSILYIKDIVNNSLVKEVRRRIESIKVDYINDTGELEQYIEDYSFFMIPQMISTERPDRVAVYLAEGRVAIVMNGTPFVLIMPVTNTDFISAAEDGFLSFPYVNLLRVLRIFALFMSLLLPGLYIAIVNFHHEMIPTDLLFAITASREKVPFPSIIEILIMEFLFELIREAGIRIPGPIGPTLGIIGALILGQAAVAASVVSPILIIIVAITGISSFAIPNFSIAFSFRILRFAYILLGGVAGFLGIATGLFIQGLSLCNAKSFGVPFMAPFAPSTAVSVMREIFRSAIWKEEKRPDYLYVKKEGKQEKISRGWTKK